MPLGGSVGALTLFRRTPAVQGCPPKKKNRKNKTEAFNTEVTACGLISAGPVNYFVKALLLPPTSVGDGDVLPSAGTQKQILTCDVTLECCCDVFKKWIYEPDCQYCVALCSQSTQKTICWWNTL